MLLDCLRKRIVVQDLTKPNRNLQTIGFEHYAISLEATILS